MRGEKFENKYPLEDILPDLEEKEVQTIVNECTYVFECNKIAELNFPGEAHAKVNTADAVVFYTMGYEVAQQRIKQTLKAIE